MERKSSSDSQLYPQNHMINTSNTGNSTGTTNPTANRQSRGSKQRLREESLVDEHRAGRKDGKRREGGKSYSSLVSLSGSKQKAPNNPQVANAPYGTRYYYREVPPRFQQQKSKHAPASTSSYSSSLSKSPHGKSNPGNKKSRWEPVEPGTDNGLTSSSAPISGSNITTGSTTSNGTAAHRTFDKDTGIRDHTKGNWMIGSVDAWTNHGSFLPVQHSQERKSQECWISDDSLYGSDPIDEQANELDDFSSDGSRGSQNSSIGDSKQNSQPANVAESDLTSFDDQMCGDQPYRDNGSSSQSDPRLELPLAQGSKTDSDPDMAKDGSCTLSGGACESPEMKPEALAGSEGAWRGYQSRGSMGSTSSVNSTGSSSSWKGDGRKANFQGRATSPRKGSRFDNNRQPLPSSGLKGVNRFNSKSKKPVDLDEAIDALQNEPSGWGDLPSPKQSEVDTGTEVWGIPDDVKEKMGRPSAVGSHGKNWNDPYSDWGDTGVTEAGWGKNEKTNQMNWTGSDSNWSSTVKAKERNAPLTDNLKKLVDMGFPPDECEQALKVNNNNLEACIGDLLTIQFIREDGIDSGNGNSSQTGKGRQLNTSATRSNGQPASGVIGSSSSTAAASVTSSLGHLRLGTQGGSLPGNNGNMAPSLNQQQMLNQQIQALQLLQQQQKQVGLHSLQQVTQMLANQQLAKQQLHYQLNQLKLVKPSSQVMQQQHQLMLSLNKINSKISATTQQLVAMEQMVSQKLQAGGTSNGLGVEGNGIGLPGKEHRGGGSNAVQQRPVSLSTTGNIGDGSKKQQSAGYAVQGVPVGSTPQTPSVSQVSARRTMSRLQQIISGSGDFAAGEIVDKDGMGMGMVGNELVVSDMDSHPKVPSPSAQQQQPRQMTSSSPDNLPVSSMVSSLNPSTAAATTPSGFASRSGHLNLVSTPSSTVTSSSSLGLPFASSTRSVDEIPEFKPGVPWQPRNQPTEPAQAYGDQSLSKMPSSEVNSKFPQSLTRSNSSSYPSSEEFYSPQDGGRGMYGNSFGPSSSTQYHHNSARAGRQDHIHRQYSSGGQSRTWEGYRKNSQGNLRGGTGGSMGHGGGSSGQFHEYGIPQQQQHPNHSFHHGRGRARPQQHQAHHKGFTTSGGYPMSMGTGTGGRRHDQFRSSQQQGGGTSYESRRWSHDNGNPWGIPSRNTSISSTFGGGVWSSDAYSPSPSDASSETLLMGTESVFSDWKANPPVSSRGVSRMAITPGAGGGHMSAAPGSHFQHMSSIQPTSGAWLLIQKVTAQVDQASLKELCAKFGNVLKIVVNQLTEKALVQYGSMEAAFIAKLGLEKSPYVNGVAISPCIASDNDVHTFFSQLSSSNKLNAGSIGMLPFSANQSTSSWLPSETTQQQTSVVGHLQKLPVGSSSSSSSLWGTSSFDFSNASTSGSSSTVELTSPWSDVGILSGISTPWNMPSTPIQDHTEDPSTTSTSPLLSTFLPNDLF